MRTNERRENNEKCWSILSLSLAFLLVVSSLSVAFAVQIDEEITSPVEKISSTLSEYYEVSDGEETPVLVWLTDIDLSSTETAALEAVDRTKEEWAAYEAAALSLAVNPASSTTSEISIEEVQTYIEVKREASAELYTAYNEARAAEILSGAEVLYISRYSPVVLVNLSRESALSVAESAEVEQITYYGDSTETIDSGSGSVNTISLSNVNVITRASTVQTSSAYGYTGDGIKIGVLEISLPNISYFTHLNIVETFDPDGNVSGVSHANNVLAIISSIAPDADYYLAASSNGSSAMSVIEDMLKLGVNIISASRSIGGSTALSYCKYGEIEQWLDHIAYQHDVHFVKSSGNAGAGEADGTANGPNSGAMAYNIITVGNLYVNGTTSYSDDEIWNGTYPSSYYTGTTLAYKPDICAPGQGVVTSFGTFGGTSAATPQVAGAIALLCEQRPALLTRQNTVKAILTSSVNFTSPHAYVPSDDNYKMYGAGLLDCVGACWVAGNYRYLNSTYTSGASIKTHTLNVTSSDTRVRISLAWNIKSVGSGTNDSSITVGDITNLNISIISPSGRSYSSFTTNNNVEIVDFEPLETGEYDIIITRADDSSETVYYALAWR